MSTFTFNDLINWSEKLPLWQRDALRRIVGGTFRDSEVDDLVAMAKADHGIPVPHAPSPNPISDDRTSSPNSTPLTVTITRLRDITNVNALGSGPIVFSPSGLTVFYGDNASGKSGIARILKKAAHARDPGGPIRPNVFEQAPTDPASAIIEFSVGTQEETYPWRDGGPTKSELTQINVFDAHCAAVQVEENNRLAYTPTILKIFENLASVCQKVAAKLKAERDALDGERPPELAALSLRSGTAAWSLVASLSPDTKLKDIDSVCDLTDDDSRRVKTLNQALQDNSTTQIALLEAKARSLNRAIDLAASISRFLTDDAMRVFEADISRAAAAEEAARVAREAFSSNSVLAGVGTAAWKELWESARRYSQELAYPGSPFPLVNDGAVCVLCQQVIAPAAGERLTKFEDFVQNDTQQRARQALTAMQFRVNQLRALEIPMSGTLKREAGLTGSDSGRKLHAYLVAAKLRRRYLLRQVITRKLREPGILPEFPDLQAARAAALQELSQLRAASQSEARRTMQKELTELDDRLKLSPLKNLLKREVARLEYCRQLDRCRTSCDTAWITRKSGEAAKSLVTGRLRSFFAGNLASLEFTSAPVEMALGSGSVGQYPYRVSLIVRGDVPPAEILSEGERTCVALAGFLAELEASDNTSAVVLDDPVSSLDHHYRIRVARLIVEASRTRQVVVFTHDIVFLSMLTKYARKSGVDLKECSLRRGSLRHGVPEDGPPWVAMRVNRRLGILRSELQSAEALLRKGDRTSYEQRAEWIYDRLRQSWERAVEEVLLNEVVLRFGDAVSTQQLKKLTDITDADVQIVDTEMSYCSSFVHDQPGAVNAGIPEPAVIRADIDKLDRWVGAIRSRRKQ